MKNTGAAIHAMVRATDQLFEELHFDDSQEWTQLTSIFGSPAIPAEAASVINEALKKMEESGEIGKKNRWQALEYWAANYLAER